MGDQNHLTRIANSSKWSLYNKNLTFEKFGTELRYTSDMKQKVYLAGQANQYDNNWKEKFKKLKLISKKGVN